MHLAWENEAHLEVRGGEGRARDRLPADQHPGRAARRGRRRERRSQEDAGGGRGVPEVPLHRRGPGDHRQALLPADQRGDPEEARGHLPRPCASSRSRRSRKDFADAHKQFIAEGGVFDTIYKPQVTARSGERSMACRESQGAAGVLADPRLHRLLPERPRAPADRGLLPQGGLALPRRVLARGLDGAGARRVPADVRHVVRRRAPSTCSSASLIAWVLVRYQLPGQAAHRFAGRPAARAADGGRRPRLREPVREEGLARAVPGAARHPGRLHAAWPSCWC